MSVIKISVFWHGAANCNLKRAYFAAKNSFRELWRSEQILSCYIYSNMLGPFVGDAQTIFDYIKE